MLRQLGAHPLIVTAVFAAFLLCLIPYIHLGIVGYLIWPEKPDIDREKCGCTCFDTVMRGSYENQPSTSYKHWYFNTTLIAYKIWCLVVIGLLVAYECFKYIFKCLMDRDIRYSMLVLFIATIFPHYYSWWIYLTYYNEEFWFHWWHQLYFTVSELISTGAVLYLMRRSRSMSNLSVQILLAINVSHLVIGGLDQAIDHIVFRNGRFSQMVRDLGLVLPDIFAVAAAVMLMKESARERNTKVRWLFSRKELVWLLLGTAVLTLFGYQLAGA